MKTRTQLRLIAGATILLASTIASTASASNTVNRSAVHVSYSDIDIRSDAGARVLYSRLKRASADVCGIREVEETRSLSQIAKAKACYERSLDRAVAKIESDALATLHHS